MKKLITLGCIALFAMGCSQSKTQVVRVAGSTTVLPIVSVAAEAYMKQHPDTKIIVNAGGSGVGVNQVGSQQIEVGMISREITQKEREQYPQTAFTIHAIGRDAVVPVVSSEIYNAGITSLTLAQIARIYRGEISNWKEVDGPDTDILVIDKEAARGTRHVFMEIVLGDKEAVAEGADLVLGANNEEQTALTQSDAAIGILSNAWLNDDVKGITIMMPDGSTVAPTLENIINNTFPITRDLVLVTHGAPTGETKAFLDFIKGVEGQEIVKSNGYVSISK